MKNLIFLLFALITITVNSQINVKNFQVTANPNNSYARGDRFDFKFDVQGIYSDLELFVYYESESRSNLLGKIHWNRDRDKPLNFPTYITKNTWFNSFLDRTVTIPGKKFILVVKYSGQRKQLVYPLSSPDSDGDGVPNSQDNCPNVAGPASNNGCPIASQNPNLAVDLDGSKVFSQCQSCLPFLDVFMNSGKRHLIAGGVGNINFDRLEIRNIGNSTSNGAQVDFYFSRDNTLQKNSDKKVKRVSIPSRNPNSSYGIQTSITGWDLWESGANSTANNGNFYILIDIDATNTNNEGTNGESNNLLAIPITYNSSSTATSRIGGLKETSSKKPYELSVFDIFGTQITKKRVADKEEENAFIQSLPKGFYIIKNGTETYKIVK
ncbi:thrombospondin type 3 repeat-containing protein [Aquimarina muelleri]|uniref:thrombospondin type 3 repeat-containing protein n=1 Tax=Aquimarina muelleri TaxID=279356 RepID=UPI003F684EB0